MAKAAGYIEDGEGLMQFSTATCQLAGGALTVRARGDGASLALIAVPFDCQAYEGLAGKSCAPDSLGLGQHADVVAEGGITLRGETFSVESISVTCKAFNAESRRLSVEVTAELDGDFGGLTEVSAFLSCSVL